MSSICMVYVWYIHGISLDIPYICIPMDIPYIYHTYTWYILIYIHDICMYWSRMPASIEKFIKASCLSVYHPIIRYYLSYYTLLYEIQTIIFNYLIFFCRHFSRLLFVNWRKLWREMAIHNVWNLFKIRAIMECKLHGLEWSQIPDLRLLCSLF